MNPLFNTLPFWNLIAAKQEEGKNPNLYIMWQ